MALDFAAGGVDLNNPAIQVGLPLTMFAVCIPDAVANGALVSTGDWNTAGAYYGANIALRATGGINCAFGDGSGSGSGARRSLSGTTGVYAVGDLVVTSCSIRGDTDQSIYHNGIDISGSYSGSAAGGIVYSAANGQLGEDGDGFFNGKMLLWFVADSNFTAAEHLWLAQNYYLPFTMAPRRIGKAPVVAGAVTSPYYANYYHPVVLG